MHVLLRKVLAPIRRKNVVELEIVSVRREYGDTWTYEMKPLKRLRFRAGQFVHLVAPDSPIEKANVRHMSPASSPLEECLTFTMDLISDSPYKRKFAAVRPGDRPRIFGITGGFTFAGLRSDEPVVFFAGGIGITPVRSLIREMELRGRRRPWVLVHVGRQHLYREELSKLPWPQYRIGRLEVPPTLDAVTAENPDSRYFVSGSNSFITDLCRMLTERGIPRERIRAEDFDH